MLIAIFWGGVMKILILLSLIFVSSTHKAYSDECEKFTLENDSETAKCKGIKEDNKRLTCVLSVISKPLVDCINEKDGGLLGPRSECIAKEQKKLVDKYPKACSTKYKDEINGIFEKSEIAKYGGKSTIAKNKELVIINNAKKKKVEKSIP